MSEGRESGERPDRPVSRDETVFTIRMALSRAQRLWPKRRVPGVHDRFRPIAEAVADHIALCGMRLVGKEPGLGPSTSHFLDAGRKKGREDGDGD